MGSSEWLGLRNNTVAMNAKKPRRRSAHLLHRSGLLRESLASALATKLQVAQIKTSSVAEYSPLLAASPPDLVLLDVSLPNDLCGPFTSCIRQRAPQARILLMVQENGPGCWDRMIDCIGLGAHGCLLEESSLDELWRAIDSLLNGDTFCSPRILDSMFGELARLPSDVRRRQVASSELTSREVEILELVAEGLGNKQIARKLSLSVFTVKNHVHNILEKLQAESRHKAVDYARERRWLNPHSAPNLSRSRWS